MNWKKFPYPLLVTMLYVAISTLTNAWDKAWLLYLTIPIYYMTFSAIIPKNKKKENSETSSEKSTESWSDF